MDILNDEDFWYDLN